MPRAVLPVLFEKKKKKKKSGRAWAQCENIKLWEQQWVINGFHYQAHTENNSSSEQKMFISPKPTSLAGGSGILNWEIQLEMLNGSRNELDGDDTDALTLTPSVSSTTGGRLRPASTRDTVGHRCFLLVLAVIAVQKPQGAAECKSVT